MWVLKLSRMVLTAGGVVVIVERWLLRVDMSHMNGRRAAKHEGL